MASTALVLLVVRSLLVVPGGWDIEDWLGWVDAPSDAPGAAMLTLWRQCGVAWLAGLYLALDTLVFIPLYAGLLLAIGTRVAAALARDPNPEADMLPSPRRAAVTRCALTAATIGLVLVDLVENGYGIAHGAPDTIWPLLAVAVIALPLLAPSFVRALRELGPWDWVAGLVLGVGVLALTGASTAACRAPDERHLRIATALGCLAHHGKLLLVMLAVLAVVVGIGLWLFAALLRRGWGDPQRQLRAELRSALGQLLRRCARAADRALQRQRHRRARPALGGDATPDGDRLAARPRRGGFRGRLDARGGSRERTDRHAARRHARPDARRRALSARVASLARGNRGARTSVASLRRALIMCSPSQAMPRTA